MYELGQPARKPRRLQFDSEAAASALLLRRPRVRSGLGAFGSTGLLLLMPASGLDSFGNMGLLLLMPASGLCLVAASGLSFKALGLPALEPLL